MFRFLLAALALLLAIPAHAQTARHFRDKVEASMVVTGHVDIGSGGEVLGYGLDGAEALPAYVVELFERNVPAFRFEPLDADGAAATARALMSARVVARRDGDAHELALRSVHFTEVDGSGVPRAIDMQPPRYPPAVLRAGGQGIAYLLVRLHPDGTVRDAAVEQVNLTVLSDARTMDQYRAGLAKAAITAARAWRFEAREGGGGDRVLRVPVHFAIGTEVPETRGVWTPYLPGPYTPPPWAAPAPRGFAPDALAGTGARAETSRFRLLTPLQG